MPESNMEGSMPGWLDDDPKAVASSVADLVPSRLRPQLGDGRGGQVLGAASFGWGTVWSRIFGGVISFHGNDKSPESLEKVNRYSHFRGRHDNPWQHMTGRSIFCPVM